MSQAINNEGGSVFV